MKTLHIERLDLRCRGIPPHTARAAMGELGAALQRQLADGAVAEKKADGSASAPIRVPHSVASAALASAVAARVVAAVRGRAASSSTSRRS